MSGIVAVPINCESLGNNRDRQNNPLSLSGLQGRAMLRRHLGLSGNIGR